VLNFVSQRSTKFFHKAPQRDIIDFYHYHSSNFLCAFFEFSVEDL